MYNLYNTKPTVSSYCYVYCFNFFVEGTQPIILEDGTTAYISHEPPTPHDNLSLDQDSLNILDTLPPVTEAEVGCKRHILTWFCMMLCSFALTFDFEAHFTHMYREKDLAGISALISVV